MSLSVDVQQACEGEPVPDVLLLGHWAQAALLGESDAELVIRIVTEQESQALNTRYRDKARPTNVLSFVFESPPEVPCALLGDLIVCAPVIAREAREQGKALESHWAHMLVHGMLHLQGYDHVEPAQAQIMEALEIQILAGLGIPDPYEA